MKKTWIWVLVGFLLLSAGMTAAGKNVSAKQEPLRIVTTIFPEYEWVLEILGEQAAAVQVTLLTDNGVDLHSFQPSVKDIVEISSCDLFVYVGGESDAWVKDALSGARNENIVALNLLELLGEDAWEEELAEGMQEGAWEEELTEGMQEGGREEEEAEYDEHVWLSLKNASFFCEKIAEALCELDPEHAQSYREHAADYQEKLAELDARYEDAAARAALDTLIFASRFPFRYLTEDYHLNYYAAFSGCEADTEASFDTIVFLAGKTDELGIPVLLTIDGDDPKIAETVRDNTREKNQQILVMDSMQSTTSEDLKNGSTYLSVMERNLEVLEMALG